MRIAFFGQSGPYTSPALRQLIAHPHPDYEIVLVVEARKGRLGRQDHRLIKAKPAPLPAGDNLEELARAAGFPVLLTRDVNAKKAVWTINEHKPDWLVVVGFDRLFSPEVLATASAGGLNAHPSDLPNLRGPSPLFWALKEGRRSLALTIHALDAKEDHGPIFAQRPFSWAPMSTGDEIYRVAGDLAGEMLIDVLGLAAGHNLVGVPQSHTDANRAPRPKAEDLEINPASWGCEQLVEFCCGAPYFRAPWMSLGEDTFFVRRGVKAEAGKKLPGQYFLQKERLIVACKDGLAHLEIQI